MDPTPTPGSTWRAGFFTFNFLFRSGAPACRKYICLFQHSSSKFPSGGGGGKGRRLSEGKRGRARAQEGMCGEGGKRCAPVLACKVSFPGLQAFDGTMVGLWH